MGRICEANRKKLTILFLFNLIAVTLIFNLARYQEKKLQKFSKATVYRYGEAFLTLESECKCRKYEKLVLVRRNHNQSDLVSVYLNFREIYSLNWTEFTAMNFTCDLYRTMRRGLGQQVIGVSLYGQSRNLF